MPIVLDASVLVALFSPSDSFHDRSVKLFEALQDQDEDILIPSLALAEVTAALFRRTGNYEFAHAALRTLKDASVIRIEDVTVELAARASRLVRYAPLRGADAIYLALAEVEDAILYTFDSEQRERGKNIVETREP